MSTDTITTIISENNVQLLETFQTQTNTATTFGEKYELHIHGSRKHFQDTDGFVLMEHNTIKWLYLLTSIVITIYLHEDKNILSFLTEHNQMVILISLKITHCKLFPLYKDKNTLLASSSHTFTIHIQFSHKAQLGGHYAKTIILTHSSETPASQIVHIDYITL